MAKKSIVRRNLKREKLSGLHREKRESLKKIVNDVELSIEERIKAQTSLSQMPRDGSISRYRVRCSLTGRGRGNLRKFKLSRIMIRELGLRGEIPGLIKSSW